MTGLELLRTTDTTADEIAGIISEPVSYTHLTLPTNREV